MVEVAITRSSDGAITACAAHGHAGPAPDAVCAGVSALIQGAALGLERRLHLEIGVQAGDGRFSFRLPAGVPAALQSRAQDILETMVLGLAEIEAQAPRRVRLSRGGPR